MDSNELKVISEEDMREVKKILGSDELNTKKYDALFTSKVSYNFIIFNLTDLNRDNSNIYLPKFIKLYKSVIFIEL